MFFFSIPDNIRGPISPDRHDRAFAKKALSLSGTPVPVDQECARFTGPETPWLRDLPSPVLRNGAVLRKQSCGRFFSGLAGRLTIKRKDGRQSVWITSELFSVRYHGRTGPSIRETDDSQRLSEPSGGTNPPREIREQGIRAVAVYPICRGGSPAGVLIVFSLFTDFFGKEMDQLLSEVTRNISFSIDNLDRLRENRKTDETILTLKNYYQALSEINALVANLPPPHDLFDKTCAILQRSEESSIVGVGPVNEETGLIDWNHYTGPGSERVSELRITAGREGAGNTEPNTMTQKFFSKKTLIVNDYMTEFPDSPLRLVFLENGFRSAALYPIFRNQKFQGTLAVVSRQTGFFGEELSNLLDGVFRSLSFVLDNRDRERPRAARRNVPSFSPSTIP